MTIKEQLKILFSDDELAVKAVLDYNNSKYDAVSLTQLVLKLAKELVNE